MSGVVTVLGRPGRGATQVEKSQCLNWATQILTVAYECFFQNDVNFLRRLALQEKKLDNSCLDVVEIARIA